MIQSEIDHLIDIEYAEIGVREIGGQNLGDRVRQYQLATYNDPGSSYCMSFQVWALMQTLGKSPLPRSGNCEVIRDWAHTQGVLRTTPKRGRIGLWINRANDYAHHAFLVRDDPTPIFETLEANTNLTGGDNGDGVYLKCRGGTDDPRLYEFIDLTELQ